MEGSVYYRKLALEQETKDKCVNTGVGQEIILNFSGYSDRCIYSQLRIFILEAKISWIYRPL